MIRIENKAVNAIRQSVVIAAILAIAILQSGWNPVAVRAQSVNDDLKKYASVDSSSGVYSFKNSALDFKIEIKPSEDSRIKSSFALYKWNKTAGFEIILPRQTSMNEIADEGGISALRLSEGDIENKFYLRSSSDFEWEIVLNDKPENNILKYAIESANLKFYYQDPDTFAAHIDDWDFDSDIPGSYAVYHNSGRNNQHKTGKAFHIYRPKAWNSDGDTVWCDLNIDTVMSTLSISIPQAFLDSAGYPVVVDPTFGCTAKGGSGISMSANNFRHLVNYNDYADADGNMQTAHICGYKISSSAACSSSIIVYSHSNTLSECVNIATSNKIEISKYASTPDSAIWFNAPISGTLEDDEDYIVSWQGKESCDYCLRICGDYTGIWGYERYADYSDWGANDDLSGYSSGSYICSVYVDYDDSGGPTDDPYIRTRKLKRSH